MAQLQQTNISTSSSGDNSIVAGVTGSQVRVRKLVVQNGVATAQTVLVKDAAGGNTLATLTLPSAIGGSVILGMDDEPWFKSATSGAFVLNLANATLVTGTVMYYVA